MSMKEAIEMLRDIKIYCNGVKHLLDCDEFSKPSFSYMYDMLNAIFSILHEAGTNHTWQPSPDTEYKIKLTRWIEQKEFALSDEAEKEKQRLLNDAVTRMQGLNINKLYLPPSTHAHPLDHEEGEG